MERKFTMLRGLALVKVDDVIVHGEPSANNLELFLLFVENKATGSKLLIFII